MSVWIYDVWFTDLWFMIYGFMVYDLWIRGTSKHSTSLSEIPFREK
jgi:hypothetical protein